MIARISAFIIFMGLLSYLQIRQFLSNKEGGKVTAVYGVLMGLAALIGSLLIAGVKMPSHNAIITNIFQPIGKAILGK
jgi:Flp pilus assembly pilin Flp